MVNTIDTLPKGNYMKLNQLPLQLWADVKDSGYIVKDVQYIPTDIVKELMTEQQFRTMECIVHTLMVLE